MLGQHRRRWANTGPTSGDALDILVSIIKKKLMLLSFFFALSAHPVFITPIDELNAIVLRLSSVHNSQEMLLLPQFSSDFNFVWIV